MNRYRQLAELFKTQIQQNTWRAGEKLPSVRVTSRNHSVSAGTVLQAYQLLEAQGWVAAKPQSGYFVTAELDRLEPSLLRPLFIALTSMMSFTTTSKIKRHRMR